MTGIHQSQFLPWGPFFHKLLSSETFVVLDHVQYQKNGVQNRNQIKTSQGAVWLTVPVAVHLGDRIADVPVADPRALGRIARSIEQSYARAPYFDQVGPRLIDILQAGAAGLHELNMALLRVLAELLGYRGSLVLSSGLGVHTAKADMVLDILRAVGADAYVTGPGAMEYLDPAAFAEAGIGLVLSTFTWEPYPQLWPKAGAFLPRLSVVDLLMNDLPGARQYIMDNGALERLA